MADERDVSTRGFVISIFGVAALLCCGTPIAGGYLYLKDSRDEPGMRAASEAYLNAAIDGENATAYDLLCESDRRRLSRADWEPLADRRTAPTGFRITDVTFERPSEAPTQRIVTVEISYRGQPNVEVNFYVKKQDGAWKICSPPLL